MTFKEGNPALLAAATGLRNVVTEQVGDAGEIAPSHAKIQHCAEAIDVVREMVALGASFTIADDGERWVWEPQPEVMRNAIRRFWRSIESRPSGIEMVRAIRAMQRGAA